MKDLYAVLGININASPTDIREAYRKLSKKFHPDLNKNDSYFENRFKEIREAYELLSDPVGRAAYDNQLKKFRTYTPAVPAEPKNRAISSVNTKVNWAFTAMLLVLTAVFGYYVVRSVTYTKKAKVVATSTETIATVVRHHKKRHHRLAKNLTEVKKVGDSIKTIKPAISKTMAPAVAMVDKPKPLPVQSTAVVSAKPVQQNITSISTPKPAIVPPVPSPAPATTDAYIKANATGIVYMRQMNNYNSEVITSIPGDSKVTVLEKVSNFYKISYNNKTGYVPLWTVQYR